MARGASSFASHRISRKALRLIAGALITSTLVACQHKKTTPAPNLAALSIARDAARFGITASTDSTVTFRAGEVRWLKAGMRGHVLDPMQRDALIARLIIQRVDTSGIVAVITGGVSPVQLSHVVSFARPSIAWWRDRRFWFGAGAGVVAGVVAASARD